jgi:putative FmdB family regulatory protein
MPTYEYECTNCHHVFEMFQSITAKPKRKPDEPCAKCGKRAPIRRLIGSGGAVLFKGSGFYQTDYRNESYKKAAEAEKMAASGSSDGAKKSDASSGDGKATKAKKKVKTGTD